VLFLGGGALKSYFKNEAAACKMSRHRVARLSGFAWSKVACVGVDVSAFESTRIYPFNRNRVSEYLLSFCDTSETITPMETAPPNIALVCVLSYVVTNSRDVSPVRAEPSLSTVSTILPSDTSLEKKYFLQCFEADRSNTENTDRILSFLSL